jgi:hypothetical protein
MFERAGWRAEAKLVVKWQSAGTAISAAVWLEVYVPLMFSWARRAAKLSCWQNHVPPVKKTSVAEMLHTSLF